jgi:hypothetical protein
VDRAYEESPFSRHVNRFTTCVLYLAMERPSRLHPACTGASLERSGPLTAGCGRWSRRSLRRHRQGAGVLRGRAQQAGRASHPRRWRRPELYGARPVIEPPGRLVRVGQGCRLAGRLHADGSEPPQLQAANQRYRMFPCSRSDQVPGWPYRSPWLPSSRASASQSWPAPPSLRIAASAYRCRCWSGPSSTLMSS